MRIYNGTKSMLDLPLTGIQRLSIPPLAVSGDFMPTNEFLSLLVTTFDYNELAIIVSGPYEISMCAGVSGTVGFVVQSLEEAIERFTEKKPVVEEIPAPVVDNKPSEEEVAKTVTAVEYTAPEVEDKVNEETCVLVATKEEEENPCAKLVQVAEQNAEEILAATEDADDAPVVKKAKNKAKKSK